MKQQFDVVVIGAGSGGLTAAVGFSKVGKSVLLVEREHMGGECTNSGCVPSKALLHHAKEYYASQQVAGEGAKSEAFRAEAFQYVRNKIDEILAEETPETFEKLGITVVMGEAIFNDKCSVAVGSDVYRYKTAIIATGSSPRLIDIPGMETSDVLTNQNIFKLSDVPERLLVVGAGPIGMEMAQAFAMLGSQVTMAEMGPRFGKLEDGAISPILQQSFTDLGIEIITNAHLQRVENRVAIFDIKDAAGNTQTENRILYDKVLLGIGRVPNLPQGLEAAGIKADERCIMVDSQYRTSNKYVYAVGDVAQKLKFTHTADDIARQIVTRVVSKGIFRINTRKAVPKVTYTQPEVAQVGLSHQAAVQKYSESEVMRIEVPFTHNDRAKTDDQTDGLLVVAVRRLNGQVLGANIIGPHAGDLIAIFTLAIDQKISMWKLRNTIYAYPTYSLIIKKAGDYFFAQQFADLKQDITHTLKKHTPKIVAAIFWLGLLYAFQDYKADKELSNTELLLTLLTFFTTSMWGPLVYMVLYAIRPLIFFPATLLTALSGILFGFWWGVIYTILGENASANFAYWIGRFFGKGLKLEDSIIGNWVEALRKRPFESVLFMRLFYVPFDLTNYGSGILKVNWRSYFLATLIGIMPGLTTFVALGAAIDVAEFQANGISFDIFDPRFLAVAVATFVGSIVLSRALKRWQVEK